MRWFSTLVYIVKETAARWQADRVPRLAAALAYYTLFSLAPAIVLALVVVGSFLEREQARSEIVLAVSRYIGPSGAIVTRDILENVSRPQSNTLTGLVGLAILFVAASTVFAHLRDALNTIMGVHHRPTEGVFGFIWDRLIAMGMLLAVGVLLLASVFTSVAIRAASDYLVYVTLPGGNQLWRILDPLVSWAVFTVVFASLYKLIPDVEIAWRDALVGAAVGALLFIVAKTVLAFYLSNYFTTQSLYSFAGSFIALLLWVYVSAQILFLGAELTEVYATHFGRGIRQDGTIPMFQQLLDEPDGEDTEPVADSRP